uniref:Uncharacterized protein n=1 Tax=Paramoeba aestuarina TaxID=180227 RepID=A0A7S4KMM5_9EUKA
MPSPLYILSTDCLGKVDKSMLSQHTLMELLIEPVIPKNRIYKDGSLSDSLSDVMGVQMNDHGEIIEINWASYGLDGSLHYQWLPLTLRILCISQNSLKGSIDLTALPPLLTGFKASKNHHDGTIELEYLPETLERLLLASNTLSRDTLFRTSSSSHESLFGSNQRVFGNSESHVSPRES